MKKEKILELLDNIEIQKKIREIVKNDTVEKSSELDKLNELRENNIKLEELVYILQKAKSKNEEEIEENRKLIAKLEAIIYDKDSSIEKLDKQIINKNHEIDMLNGKLKLSKEQIKSLEDKVLFYKDTFGEDLKMYELFKNLNKDIKESLSGIFKTDTLEGVISCGVQEKNISSFWEYIKSEIVDNKDIDDLVKIFNFMFKRVKLAYPMYELQKVSVGDSFDTQLHIKHNSSNRTSGSIKKILFKGYINTKTSKVIKQSIVVI